MINGFGVFIKRSEKNTTTPQHLVNQPTQRSENSNAASPIPLFENVLRGKCEPLKSYGIRLCSQGLRETWLKYLEVNKDLIIANRRDALLERFPNSVFRDLSGKSYYGWKARRLLSQREKELKPDYNAASDYFHLFQVYRTHYCASAV